LGFGTYRLEACVTKCVSGFGFVWRAGGWWFVFGLMLHALQLIAAILVLAGSIYAVKRKVDVRLALLIGALALGLLVGDPVAILRTFLVSMTDYKFVLPIACAMGFGYVLQHTGCGEQLARLLLKPFHSVPFLLVPGAVLIGFVVNIPVVSQSSTAATVGAVLVPVLLAAGISPLTTGAALLLGCSIGGELMNPAGPEYATVIRESSKVSPHAITGAECVAQALPMVLINLVIATLVFSILSLRYEKAYRAQKPVEESPAVADTGEPATGLAKPSSKRGSRINLAKAAVPLIPLVILFLTAKPFQVVHLPAEPGFLVTAKEVEDVPKPKLAARLDDLRDTRLIGLAMLIGVLAAAGVCLANAEDRACVGGIAKSFFEGTGYAFTNVISLIAVAGCLAEGIKMVGIGDLIGHFATSMPPLLLPLAGTAALLFALLCGSGIAATQGLVGIFVGPGAHQGMNLAHLGAFTSTGSAIGRTMSPVSAVALMCAKLTSQDVVQVVKLVALPLLAGFVGSTVWALLT
jgi:C4-dicarboxylate transporter, DcuC family